MKIKNDSRVVELNTISNWPLIVDLFMKWGYPYSLLEQAKTSDEIEIYVENLDDVTAELSAWGIPWKGTFK